MQITCPWCGAIEGRDFHANTCSEHPSNLSDRREKKMTGVVVKKKEEKMFGFVRPDGMDRDFFFHKDDCICNFQDLREGRKVTFEEAEGIKGPRAVALDIIGKEN